MFQLMVGVFGRQNDMVVTFGVQGSVEVIACVRIPVWLAARLEDEKLALRRTTDPQRQPEVIAFAERNGISIFVMDEA
jgi:hypothetical protein